MPLSLFRYASDPSCTIEFSSQNVDFWIRRHPPGSPRPRLGIWLYLNGHSIQAKPAIALGQNTVLVAAAIPGKRRRGVIFYFQRANGRWEIGEKMFRFDNNEGHLVSQIGGQLYSRLV